MLKISYIQCSFTISKFTEHKNIILFILGFGCNQKKSTKYTISINGRTLNQDFAVQGLVASGVGRFI
jgi:hypothetical protein